MAVGFPARRRRAGGLRWLGAATTPWIVGAGLVVSFTASAGYDVATGSSVVPGLAARAMPPLPPGELLVPPVGAVRAEVAFAPPRADLKSRARVYPLVDRGLKGDPILVLRTTLSRRAGALPASTWLAVPDGALVSPLVPGQAAPTVDLEAEAVFAPWPAEAGTTTDAARAESSPATAASGGTGASRVRPATAGRVPHALDGATPSVPRAVALSSTTPAPADATPVEVAAGALARPYAAHRASSGATAAVHSGLASTSLARAEPDPADRARYADLIAPDNLDRESRCLAEAVYFEARSEPEQGQAAVAQVVLNRVKSGLYPASVCGVVYQNRHRYLGCQFSFACEGKSLRITDPGSWATATRVARSVVEGRTYLADVGAATHYHADYVRPAWSRRLKRMDTIGRHVFYTLRPGQT